MFGHPPSTNEQQQYSKGQTDNCIQREKISLSSGIWFELKISLSSGILKPRDTCIATIKK
jgi:hypothetical protein